MNNNLAIARANAEENHNAKKKSQKSGTAQNSFSAYSCNVDVSMNLEHFRDKEKHTVHLIKMLTNKLNIIKLKIQEKLVEEIAEEKENNNDNHNVNTEK